MRSPDRSLATAALALTSVALAALAAACGSTAVDGGGTTTSTSTATSAGGAGSGSGSSAGGGGSSAGGGGTTSTTGAPTKCGPSLTCQVGEICVIDTPVRPCTKVGEDAGACPDGQELKDCSGGAFIQTCCCEAQPPDEYRCRSTSGCAGAPDCTCVTPDCSPGTGCMPQGGDPPALHCFELPQA